MEFGANVPHRLRHGAALNLALLDFAGTAVDDVVPLRFGVNINDVVKAGNEFPGQESPVLNRQRKHFGNFFSSNAHVK